MRIVPSQIREFGKTRKRGTSLGTFSSQKKSFTIHQSHKTRRRKQLPHARWICLFLSCFLSFFLSLTTEIENLVQTPHNKNGKGGVVVINPSCLRSVKMQLPYLEAREMEWEARQHYCCLFVTHHNTTERSRASARTQFLSSQRARARSTMRSAKVRCLSVWLSEANCAREDSNERGWKNKCCEVFQAILAQYETIIGMNRRRFLRVKNNSMLFVVRTMMMAQPDKRSTVAMRSRSPRLKCNDCVTTSSTI